MGLLWENILGFTLWIYRQDSFLIVFLLSTVAGMTRKTVHIWLTIYFPLPPAFKEFTYQRTLSLHVIFIREKWYLFDTREIFSHPQPEGLAVHTDSLKLPQNAITFHSQVNIDFESVTGIIGRWGIMWPDPLCFCIGYSRSERGLNEVLYRVLKKCS